MRPSACTNFQLPDLYDRFLHDQSHFAVAQKKYVFIYDRDGVELHQLKSHIEPTRLEFLPYHWLLASIVSPATASNFIRLITHRATQVTSNTKTHPLASS